jgi:hypothetical protein
MKSFLRFLVLFITCCGCSFASDQTIQSTWAESDSRFDANPASSFWRGSPAIYTDADGCRYSRQP